MREQLCQYVKLLFAGTTGTEDIQQEILQNTLERYDDLVAQGKTPEAAYQLAITGIGDLQEIWGTPAAQPEPPAAAVPAEEAKPAKSRLYVGLGTVMFITCPIPVLVFQNALGVGLLLAMVAVGVLLCILAGGEKPEPAEQPKSPLRKSIHTLAQAVVLVLYFLISFSTGAWHITWLIFLIGGAVEGLIAAILDLMEVS